MSDRAINHNLLDDMKRYLARSDRFSRIYTEPEDNPDALTCSFDTSWYPPAVEEVMLNIRWRINNDFEMHYRELYTDGESWECRWDRHPNSHNTREHYHPGPDAARDEAEDAEFPDDWRDVFTLILSEIEDRQKAFWE
jgi:hypothetical protein